MLEMDADLRRRLAAERTQALAADYGRSGDEATRGTAGWLRAVRRLRVLPRRRRAVVDAEPVLHR
jgi:hypothetical protein